MKLVLDTNVVLDLLLNRAPFAEAAAAVFTRIESGLASACVCTTTITTVHYLAHKTVGDQQARHHIQQLLTLLEVAPVTRAVIDRALRSPLSDFEGAVLAESAHLAKAQAIITRNGKDFQGGPLRIYTPQEWLAAN
ncbi:MAG: PIN domain-containing protein [Burkholderiales bacterium]|nr:PIN domain-containing protein [Burkholderiales bacterium]